MNTYTIRGLKVPELEERLAAIQEQLTACRTLLDAAIGAIERLDADVALIANVVGIGTADER